MKWSVPNGRGILFERETSEVQVDHLQKINIDLRLVAVLYTSTLPLQTKIPLEVWSHVVSRITVSAALSSNLVRVRDATRSQDFWKAPLMLSPSKVPRD